VSNSNYPEQTKVTGVKIVYWHTAGRKKVSQLLKPQPIKIAGMPCAASGKIQRKWVRGHIEEPIQHETRLGFA